MWQTNMILILYNEGRLPNLCYIVCSCAQFTFLYVYGLQNFQDSANAQISTLTSSWTSMDCKTLTYEYLHWHVVKKKRTTRNRCNNHLSRIVTYQKDIYLICWKLCETCVILHVHVSSLYCYCICVCLWITELLW